MRFNEPTKKENKFFNSFNEAKEIPVIEVPKTEIKQANWQDKYKEDKTNTDERPRNYEDNLISNKMIQLKNIDNTNLIQGKPGMLYFDKTNDRALLFIDNDTGWAELLTTPAFPSSSESPSLSPST
jgi:hypothetical protein